MRRALVVGLVVAAFLAGLIGFAVKGVGHSAQRCNPGHPCPTPVPSWAEEFTSGMGNFYGDDHDYVGTPTIVRPAQCSVSGGLLNLTSRYLGEGRFESCMALTSLTFDHGYFETRMKYPAGDFDAAFWLRRPIAIPSPRSEIDIAEATPVAGCPGPNQYFATMHYVSGGVLAFHQFTKDAGVSLVDQWHTFGAEWLPGSRLTFYFDGASIGTITADVLAATDTMNIVLSLGVGTWCAPTPGAETPTLATMQVDYVRWRAVR